MYVFETKYRKPSVSIARDRLKALIVADRMQCQPYTYEFLCRELFRTVSKYMKVTEEQFDVDITRSRITIDLTGDES